jgi:hypothetical protein
LDVLGGLAPQLFANAGPELLDGNLGLEDPPHALAPVVVEGEHLGLDSVLAALAVVVDDVHLALDDGELSLEGAQLGLEVVVADEPGILAPAVEELEVLGASVEVGVGNVGALEDGAEGAGG